MSRRKEETMKDRKNRPNHAKEQDKGSGSVTISRWEYDTLIRHDMLYSMMADMIRRHKYIDAEALSDFLGIRDHEVASR